MKTKSKKKTIITTIAVITAVVGAAVAVAAYLKRKAKAIGETLDYDASLYYEDDDYLDEPECPVEAEDVPDGEDAKEPDAADDSDQDVIHF